MAKLIFTIILLFWASVATAQTFVQFAVDGSSAPWASDGIAPVTATSPFTVGNTACFGGFVENNRTMSTVVDDGAGGSNTYTQIEVETGTSLSGWIWCAKIERVAQTITTTMATTGALGKIFLSEFSNTNATDWIGGSSSGQDTTGTTHASGTVTVVAPSSVIWGFTGGTVGSYTVDATFTSLNVNGTTGIAGYKAVTANTDMINTTAVNEATVTMAIEILPPDIVPFAGIRIRIKGNE